MKSNVTQEKLREICWDIGTRFPEPHQGDRIALATIRPHQGFLHWHLEPSSVSQLHSEVGAAFDGAHLVVRVYDVTDVLFDGLNAHGFFDIDVNGLFGTHYFHVERLERNVLTEVGFRRQDGVFHPLARSHAVFFDRDRPTGNMQVGGLFVGKGFHRVFHVENTFDAGVYDRLHRILEEVGRQEALSVALIHVGVGVEADWKGPLGSSIKRVSQACEKLGGKMCRFPREGKACGGSPDASRPLSMDRLERKPYEELVAQHQRTPFHLVHGHDWSSAGIGIQAKNSLDIPLVLTLHSTEHERAQAHQLDENSQWICDREREAVHAADLVIVAHSSTRQQVINIYGGDPASVVIIPDLFEDAEGAALDQTERKQSLGLPPHAPIALFAGEMSHAAGADLIMDALPTVCGENADAQFVFAGEGPLKGELEGRAWHAGLGHRCRFFGDIPRDTFESLLLASAFVVIPARTWQDEGLAQWAIACGRPVLTTHQAHIPCVVHGENGVVTYDNPGSIIWGLKEMLAHPLHGQMMRQVARHRVREAPLLETLAAEHYVYYETVLNRNNGGGRV